MVNCEFNVPYMLNLGIKKGRNILVCIGIGIIPKVEFGKKSTIKY